MGLGKLVRGFVLRTPIARVPVEWDRMGYTTDFFNAWASGPGFAGWPEELRTEEEAGVIADLLGCAASGRILDVACGYGRHCLALARRGFRVTGVDISPGLVAAAKRIAGEAGASIECLVGDARDMRWDGGFDGALIAYNSFSLFSDADASRVLAGVRRALVPVGRFFLDLDNLPAVWPKGESFRDLSLSPGGFKLQEVCFHADISVEVCRDLYVNLIRGRVDEFLLFKRLYDEAAIRCLLEGNGFKVGSVYGGWDLEPPGVGRLKLLVTCARA